MSVKKIVTAVTLGIFFLVLSGCGNKNIVSETPAVSSNDTTNTQIDNSQKMPEATGNVDDTVDAIISGATNEGEEVLSTDADAAEVIGDGQDTNNLNNTYDENAL